LSTPAAALARRVTAWKSAIHVPAQWWTAKASRARRSRASAASRAPRATSCLSKGFGLILTLGGIVRNWGTCQWWPLWLIDFIALALLIARGAATPERELGW